MLGVNENFWALGIPVQRGYYITHDIAGDRVGFVPLAYSGKAVPVYSPAKPSEPNTALNEPLPMWLRYTFFIVVGLGVLGAFGYLIYLLFTSDYSEETSAFTSRATMIDTMPVNMMLASLEDLNTEEFANMVEAFVAQITASTSFEELGY